MSHDIRISARFRKEPDYSRLARALLQFLEDEAAATKPDVEPEGEGQDHDAVGAPVADGESVAEGQP